MHFAGTLLQLVGAICEIIGVVLMTRSLLVIKIRSALRLLGSALIRGASARGVEYIPEQPQSKMVSLQGLAFIALGFFFQAVSALLTLMFR